MKESKEDLREHPSLRGGNNVTDVAIYRLKSLDLKIRSVILSVAKNPWCYEFWNKILDISVPPQYDPCLPFLTFIAFSFCMFVVYTDGSCIGNPWPWGWAAIIQSKQGEEKGEIVETQEVILTWNAKATTNNVMELTAAIKALHWLYEHCRGEKRLFSGEEQQEGLFLSPVVQKWVVTERVVLITDSNYVKLGITEWMSMRKRRQRRRAKWGKLVENVLVWKELDALVACCTALEWEWTKAHVGTELNERVDQLARQEAEKRLATGN